jgi:hypothetical protein
MGLTMEWAQYARLVPAEPSFADLSTAQARFAQAEAGTNKMRSVRFTATGSVREAP